jgi:hypothetical protein
VERDGSEEYGNNSTDSLPELSLSAFHTSILPGPPPESVKSPAPSSILIQNLSFSFFSSSLLDLEYRYIYSSFKNFSAFPVKKRESVKMKTSTAQLSLPPRDALTPLSLLWRSTQLTLPEHSKTQPEWRDLAIGGRD